MERGARECVMSWWLAMKEWELRVEVVFLSEQVLDIIQGVRQHRALDGAAAQEGRELGQECVQCNVCQREENLAL